MVYFTSYTNTLSIREWDLILALEAQAIYILPISCQILNLGIVTRSCIRKFADISFTLNLRCRNLIGLTLIFILSPELFQNLGSVCTLLILKIEIELRNPLSLIIPIKTQIGFEGNLPAKLEIYKGSCWLCLKTANSRFTKFKAIGGSWSKNYVDFIREVCWWLVKCFYIKMLSRLGQKLPQSILFSVGSHV